MANPSKKKGTAAETRVVKYLRSFGIQAERRALSGAKDQGDLWVDAPRWFEALVMEVKGGAQTANPNRGQLDMWMTQTIVEGENAGCSAILVVARHGKSPADYDVWSIDISVNGLTHWYLDDWCRLYGEEEG